jgi:hypothetical protein
MVFRELLWIGLTELALLPEYILSDDLFLPLS